MKNKSIKKNYIFNLIYNLTNLLVPLLIAPFLSRILEVDGIGIKSYTLSIVSNFILFSNLGIAEYGQREIAKCRDSKYESSKKLYEIGLLRIITTIIVLAIYIYTLVVPIMNGKYNIIYAILIINIISNMLDFSWFLKGLEEFKIISYVQVISKIFMVIMTFGLVKTKDDLNIAILINSVTLLLNSLMPLIKIRKYCIKINIKELKIFKHLKECIVYFIPAIATQIYTVLDKTMIGVITDSNFENGYYEQADKVVKILITVVTTSNAIMKSRISYLYEKREMNEIKRLTIKSASLCMLIAIPITFGIIAVSEVFVPIFFGQGYEKTSAILCILAPLAIVIGLSGLIGSHYYTPTGKKKISNRYLITGSVVNFVFNLVLIRKLGSIGAAISSITSETLVTTLYLINCDKDIFNIKILLNISYKYFISGIIMLIAILIIKQYLEIAINTLILLVLVGIIIYIGVLLLIKDKYVYEMLYEVKGRMINARK